MSSRLTPASRAILLTELKLLLGDRCTTNATELEHHSHSESWHPAGVPDVVVYPLSTDEVSAILQVAAGLARRSRVT
jgi:D-lactate dehydrogenase (cytochrome)